MQRGKKNEKHIKNISEKDVLVNYLPFNNSFRTRKTTIINEGAILLNCKFVSKNNNTIIFHSGGIRDTVFHIFGSNNIIEIGENASINNGEFWIEDDYNNVIIGSNTHLCGKIHLACTEGKTIRIGNDCLLSSEIVFRTGDSHFIIDLNGIVLIQQRILKLETMFG